MVQNQAQNSHVLIVGAAVIDIIVRVERLPQTGEDVYGNHETTMVGGCAYNVQQVIQQFGLKNTLFVPIGKGPYADIIRKQFSKKDIPMMLEDPSQDNGWNISFVEADGERTFLTVPGIETCWKKEWFNLIQLADYDFIYVSGYELEGASGEVLATEIKNRKAPHAKVIFDPGPRVSFLSKSVLDCMLSAGTIVHCNRDELMALFPNHAVEEAANKLASVTGEAVVVTMGKKGCYFVDKNHAGIIPAQEVQVVDTIGAGDSHTGAFISGLVQGLSIEAACQLGNDISAKVIQQSGGVCEI